MAKPRTTFAVVVVASMFTVGAGESPVPDALDAECKNLSIELGATLSRFDQCALDHSRPFEVCLRCAPVYDQAHKLFSDVIHFRTPRSKKCRELIVDGKVSLVKVNYEHMKYVWSKQGICDACFVAGSFNVTELVTEFFVLRNQLNNCINETRDSNSTCDSCHPGYRNLTEYFDHALHLENYKGHSLCLDMVDAMNRTRSLWADICFHPQKTPNIGTLFLIALPACFIPMFYVILRVALGAKETELAEPNTLRSVLLYQSYEFRAAIRDRLAKLGQAAKADSSEIHIVR